MFTAGIVQSLCVKRYSVILRENVDGDFQCTENPLCVCVCDRERGRGGEGEYVYVTVWACL